MDIPVRVLLHMINLGALSGMASGLAAAAAAQAKVGHAAGPATLALSGMGAALGGIAAASALVAAALVTAGAIIVVKIAEMVFAAIKMAMTFETSFANVKKALQGTEPQMAVVRKGLLDLSLAIPVGPNQLAAIAALGAQLGVTRGDIVSFTKTIATFGTAVEGMTMEQATNSVAKFAAVMGNSKNWELITNVIVDLGNKGNSTEAKIISMATRIGAAGHEIGLSIPAVLGFSAAMANVGIEAFRGGSQANTILLAMRDAAVQGGEKLKIFASIADMLPAAFQKMVKESPDQAIRALAIGMTTTSERGIDLVKSLAEVGVKGKLATLSFLQLKGSGDLVRKAFDDAAEAAKRNNAAIEEARKKWETAANQIQLLKNAFEVAGINIGTVFLPAVAAVATMLRPVLLSIAILTHDLGPSGATGAVVRFAQMLTGMFLVSLAAVLDTLAKWVRDFAVLQNALEMAKVAVMLFGAKVTEVFAKIRLVFGDVAGWAKQMAISDAMKREAIEVAKASEKTKAGLEKVAAGMITTGIVALQSASKQKGLADQFLATGKTSSLLGEQLKETGKGMEGLAGGTEKLTGAKKRAAEAAAKLASAIGTAGLASEIKKMEQAITTALKNGGALTKEGIEKIAKLAAEGAAAGLALPPQMQAILATRLAESLQGSIDKAKKILADRNLKQGGIFSFEEIQRASMVVRGAQTGVAPQRVGENGLWTVDPKTIRGFRDLAAEAAKAEAATVKYLEALAEAFGMLGSMLGSIDDILDTFGVKTTSALRQIVIGFAQVADGVGQFIAGMASGDPAAMLAGVAGALKGIKGMVDSSSGATRAAGGALAGFLVAGIPGAIVGAIIFGLRQPSWVRVAKEAGAVLGEEISEEMAKEIEQRAKDMNLTIHASALLSLPGLMDDSKRGPLEFGRQIADLMIAIGNGTVPAVEGMKALEEATGKVFKELENLGTAGSALVGDFLEAARASGTLTKQMKDMAGAAGKEFADGMKQMFDAINNGYKMSAENVGKLGELAAFAYARLRALGFTMVEAMTMLGPAIDSAIKAIEKSGATVGPMLAQMIAFRNRVLDNKDLVNFAEGLNKAAEAALRLGLALNPEQAANFAAVATQAFNDLLAAGFSAAEAVSILGGSMRVLNELAERGVIVLTEEQQAMLAVARANGELDGTPQEQMLAVMKDIRDVLIDVARAFGVVTGVTDGARSAADRWAAAIRGIPTNIVVKITYQQNGPPPPGNPNGNQNDDDSGGGEAPAGGGGRRRRREGYASGGIVIAPMSGKSVTVHGTEAITPLEQVYGKMADVVASKVADAGTGNNQPIYITMPVYVAGRKVDEVIMERNRAGFITIKQDTIDA